MKDDLPVHLAPQLERAGLQSPGHLKPLYESRAIKSEEIKWLFSEAQFMTPSLGLELASAKSEHYLRDPLGFLSSVTAHQPLTSFRWGLLMAECGASLLPGVLAEDMAALIQYRLLHPQGDPFIPGSIRPTFIHLNGAQPLSDRSPHGALTLTALRGMILGPGPSSLSPPSLPLTSPPGPPFYHLLLYYICLLLLPKLSFLFPLTSLQMTVVTFFSSQSASKSTTSHSISSPLV